MRARPTFLAFAVVAVFGVALGAGSFTAVYGEGTSYLRDDPEACANCHVMQEQLDGYERSSHRAVAVCNDCHAPEGFLAKWWTKGDNGWRHSVAFTTDDFVEPIRIGARNRAITEAACRRCHADLVADIEHTTSPEPVACIRCHSDVGHLH